MIKMQIKYLVVGLSLLIVAGSVNVAFGHGLGTVESELLYINENYLKVKVETNPDVLEGNESEIDFDITTINDDTSELVSNVEYKIEILNGANGDLLLEFNAYSPDDKLSTQIIPNESETFQGEKTESGSWIGQKQSPLVIEAPLFVRGGLVQVNVTILSIDSEPVSGSETIFETLLTIGEYIPFEITHDDTVYDFLFATYFDRIEEFQYDEEEKKLTALMPFNWDESFIEKVPFVHAEYYIPKELEVFRNHDILMTVNEISILGTIDRSDEEEIVVHFLIPTSKLLKLYEEIPEDQHDRIVFGIESGKKREVVKSDASLEEGDKVIVKSTQEDWKFHLTLTPKGKINPGTEISFNIEFHDPVTNALIPQIKYDFDVLLNGETIESKKGLETPDGKDIVNVTFPETGAVIARISNVNDYDTSGEFSFRVSEPKVQEDYDHLVEIAQGSSVTGCEKTNECYIPYSLSIQPKETVQWQNKDNTAHTVTSGTPDNGATEDFDSGVISGGDTFTHTFDMDGLFDYYCTLHPWMIGNVAVGNVEQKVVPDWVKNNAQWWSEGQISDNDFATGLEFLIKENIIDVPSDVTSSDKTESKIPEWLRNNAQWWSEDLLSDSEFLKGIEWMITNGLIKV